MSIRRPRRIFRSALRPAPAFPVGRALMLGGAVVGGVAVLALGAASTDLFGRAPKSSARLAASAAQVAVVDGETLRLRDTVVRLAGIEAPPRGAPCRGADGTALDCGGAAANALAGLVRLRDVECRLQGLDTLGRPLAVCDAGGTELNRAQVAAGWARARGPAVADLHAAEAAARDQRLGVWASGAVAF